MSKANVPTCNCGAEQVNGPKIHGHLFRARGAEMTVKTESRVTGKLAGILRPSSGLDDGNACGRKRRWRQVGRCGICGEYDGFHARCWWLWITEEQVLRGGWDGEQQIEPDEPWPSRWTIFTRQLRTLFDPRWWWFCWGERINPWPFGQE